MLRGSDVASVDSYLESLYSMSRSLMLRNGYIVPCAHIVRGKQLEVIDLTKLISPTDDGCLERLLRAKAADPDVSAIAVTSGAVMTIQSNTDNESDDPDQEVIQVIVQRRWKTGADLYLGLVSRDDEGRVVYVFDEGVVSGARYGGKLTGLFEKGSHEH